MALLMLRTLRTWSPSHWVFTLERWGNKNKVEMGANCGKFPNNNAIVSLPVGSHNRIQSYKCLYTVNDTDKGVKIDNKKNQFNDFRLPPSALDEKCPLPDKVVGGGGGGGKERDKDASSSSSSSCSPVIVPSEGGERIVCPPVE